MPPGLKWTSGVLGAAAIAVFSMFHGSLKMDEEASRTSSTIQCFHNAEQKGMVRDGLATWWLARYLNAARHAEGWKSPHVVVQLLANNYPPNVDPRDNNLLWFHDGFRSGKGRLNFLVTHSLPEETIRFFRERVGVPDRVITCPVRPDGKETYELWIWDRADAQQRLTDFVLFDSVRSPFSPVIGATSMAIDAVWGMYATPGQSDLIDHRRVWRRGSHPPGEVLQINAMWVPSGRYRLDLQLKAVALSSADAPVAELHLVQDHVKQARSFPIAAGPGLSSFELEIDNFGGPTSGAAISFSLTTGAAEAIEVAGATLTLVERRRISPFGIFR